MKRSELTAILGGLLGPEHIVICGMGATTFAWQATQAETPTYYSADPMGLGGGLALGYAVASPSAEVVFLAGDGDLVMNLPVLLAWADANPANLRMVVFHNRRYETGGGQPLPAADSLRLAEAVSALGIRQVLELYSADHARAVVEDFLRAPAPAVLVVDVDPEPTAYPDLPDVSGVEDRADFQRRAAQVRGSAD